MADDKYTFEQARIRLEEIAAEVRKKDTSLEKSLDLLEEGVRLANICTELVDHTDTSAAVAVSARPDEAGSAAPGGGEEPGAGDAGDGFDDADDTAEDAEDDVASEDSGR